jgi:polysaccharide export outer membrane protein
VSKFNILLYILIILTLIPYYIPNAQQLKAGDGVRLIFLDITDDISGDYYIQADGNLQLPVIGILSTSAKSFPAIKMEIISKYERFYKNPELTVLALYRINILGEVNSPGFYYATEEQKLRDIFALADGVTGDADLDGVYIIRENKEIELDVETIMQEGDTAGSFGLQSGDQIFVPRSFWADPARFTWIFSAIAAIVAVIAIFISR